MQINQILVPTDFSENAQHAVSYALEMAKQCSAKLHLLHTPVIPTYLLMDLSYSPGPEAVTRILNESQDALDEQAQAVAAAGVEHFAKEIPGDQQSSERNLLIPRGRHLARGR